MALLPYSVRQVTQRSRSGRRDRDRLDPSAPMPTPDAPPPVGADENGELPEGVTMDATGAESAGTEPTAAVEVATAAETSEGGEA